MIERVEALMREVAAAVVLPRFQRLTVGEIDEKGPGDLVTVADRDAERLLEAGLVALLPGSRVVGEEAVSEDSRLLSLVTQPGLVWLVDPVDGTANFAAGREPFVMMVALARDGATIAGWILNPLSGVVAVAEQGGGAQIAGVRASVPTKHRSLPELRGLAAPRYTPAPIQARIEAALDAVVDAVGATVGEALPGRNCAGFEYLTLLGDEQQFAFFWHTAPWDHAAGVLLVEEAGGVAWRLDHTPYHVGDGRTGLLVAQNQWVWDAVRTSLLGGVTETG